MIKNSVVRKSLKYVLVPLLILVSGFYVYIESQAVDLMMVDGVCTNGIAPLYKASNELSLDELKQKLDIKSEKKDSSILKEFENLQKTYSNGDQIFELETNNTAWKGLYGSWGYGVVRNNCVVSYIEIIVS